MMQLRSNVSLKLFALILFALEFLVPSVGTGFISGESVPEKIQLTHCSSFNNPLFSVFFEEMCESEEGKEFNKIASAPSHLISLDLSHFPASTNINSVAHFSSHQPSLADMPLFLAQCRLLI